jgi:hypothetical protein
VWELEHGALISFQHLDAARLQRGRSGRTSFLIGLLTAGIQVLTLARVPPGWSSQDASESHPLW